MFINISVFFDPHIIFIIWKEMNNRVFQNTASDPYVLIEKVVKFILVAEIKTVVV